MDIASKPIDFKKFAEISFFLLDLDGTIYLGDQLLPGALDFLKKIKQVGKRYVFLTNNSSRNKLDYVKKLKHLGIEVSEAEVLTSGDATAIYLLKQKVNPKVYLLGTPKLAESFEKFGLTLSQGRNDHPDFVVLAFDTTLTYQKIWDACDYIRAGAPFIATHPDFNCPLPNRKAMPDAGAMIEMFKAATGVSPLVIGKPARMMVDVVASQYGVELKNMAMVGDRLYTDIAMGTAAGIASILVLTGETRSEDYLNQEQFKATFVFDSVKDMIDLL
ncbi:unnamed protein product [Didymodactylos carnosus]|uniref:Phosphoglycolate phosphatase n=1 Tax=Didymodactylos carnosus TaxID=1234261 RepID=A0A8S2GV40_9BILA|nr:unnamed protein product [Didymodactylos carnosus]CAF3565367.1 unnamed protein product [Didymodactylos carnosus]